MRWWTSQIISLLTKRGILADQKIDSEKVRSAKQEKTKNSYHNTLMLLQQYRTIVWMMECFPETIAEELELGVPISMAVCVEVSKKSFAGAVVPYQFPFLQMGLFLLVLFGMEVVLSVWMVRRQKKQSLVEQIRAQS